MNAGTFENMVRMMAIAPMMAWAVFFFGGSALLASNAVALAARPRRRR